MAAAALSVTGLSLALAANEPSALKEQPLAVKTITAEDVAAAGFSHPQIQLPTGDGNYPSSVSYFWVGDGKQRSPAKNLVMVSLVFVPASVQNLFVYGTTKKVFPVDGGKGLEATLGGTRTAINFLKQGRYVVVIGPSAKETEALASIVASKI